MDRTPEQRLSNKVKTEQDPSVPGSWRSWKDRHLIMLGGALLIALTATDGCIPNFLNSSASKGQPTPEISVIQAANSYRARRFDNPLFWRRPAMP